jgi:hypothetical protein
MHPPAVQLAAVVVATMVVAVLPAQTVVQAVAVVVHHGPAR